MPRNVSNIYSIPPGTEGFPDTTIESEKYNTYIHDVETDLNRPRPISAGGTGADDADEALANLGAEKSTQLVTNYNTHVFLPGSFYSDIGATGAPPAPAGQTAAHKFVGIAMSSDPPATPPANLNVVIRAYNQSSTVVPGRTYIRERKNGGAWSAWSIDGTGVAGPVPPTDPSDGLLWFDSEGGHLYVWYRDIDSAQWVIASPFSDPAQFLLKAGDTMEGVLGLYAPPVAPLDAANKAYVDDAITTRVPPPFPVGTAMVFHQATAPTGWVTRTDLHDAALRVMSSGLSSNMTQPTWSTVFWGQPNTGDHILSANEQANMSVDGTFYGSGSGATASGGLIVYRTDAAQIGWAYGAPSSPAGLAQSDHGVTVNVGGNVSGTARGGNAGHSHPLNLAVRYVDVMVATKS